MDSVQKFALVDPRILKTLQTKTPTRTTPIENVLSALDKQMKDIVEEPGTDEEKVKLYNQALRRYRFYTDTLLSHPVPATEKKELRTGETAKELIKSRIVDSMPKTLKNKARRVMDMVQENPNVDFSSSGQLVVDGKAIQGSNMEDLVHNVVRTRRLNSMVEEPTGWKDFLAFLTKANAPSSLLGYKKRRVPIRLQTVRRKRPASLSNRTWVDL